jgi:hypothetical protein
MQFRARAQATLSLIRASLPERATDEEILLADERRHLLLYTTALAPDRHLFVRIHLDVVDEIRTEVRTGTIESVARMIRTDYAGFLIIRDDTGLIKQAGDPVAPPSAGEPVSR